MPGQDSRVAARQPRPGARKPDPAHSVSPPSTTTVWPIAWSDAYRREAADKAVLKRRCAPEDIAEVIVFLGFGAAMVTGQTVVVDGGLTL